MIKLVRSNISTMYGNLGRFAQYVRLCVIRVLEDTSNLLQNFQPCIMKILLQSNKSAKLILFTFH